MTDVTFPPPVDVDEIRQHVSNALPGFYRDCPSEVMVLANDVQPLLRAYDELRAEAKALSDQIAVTNLEMAEWSKRALSAEAENKRLRAALEKHHDPYPSRGVRPQLEQCLTCGERLW
jgi:hypothetical protein